MFVVAKWTEASNFSSFLDFVFLLYCGFSKYFSKTALFFFFIAIIQFLYYRIVGMVIRYRRRQAFYNFMITSHVFSGPVSQEVTFTSVSSAVSICLSLW